jgi:signal transduction histidine kinase
MFVPRAFNLLFLFLISMALSATDQDLRDSLKAQIEVEVTDSIRMRLLFDLAEEFGASDTLLSFTFLDQGKVIAQTLDDKRAMGRYYKILGKIYARSGSYEEALLHYDRALAYFNESDDHLNFFKTIKQKGNVYLFRSDYNQAMNLYQTALDFFKRNKMSVGTSRCLNNMGIIYKNRGEYVEALSVYQESVLYLDSVVHAFDIAQAYINMGNVFVHLGTYDRGLEYFTRALEIAEREGFQGVKSLCLSNSGVVQNKIGNYTAALDHYQRSMSVSTSLNNPFQTSNCLINIGTNYAAMGQFEKGLEYVKRGMEMKIELEDERSISNCYIHMADIYVMMDEIDAAIALYNKSIPVKIELGDLDGLVRCYLGLGAIAMQRDRYGEAEQMANLALEIAEKIRTMEYLAEAYQLKKELAFILGNYKSAYENATIYHLYRDSLMDEAASLAAMEMEFRNRSKELQQENENLRIQSNLDRLMVRKRTFVFHSSLVIVSVLLLGLILVLYFMRRHKSAKLKLEEKNLVITRQNMKLDQVNKTKDRMMSIIAHDLRGTIGNQLTAVEVLTRIEGDDKVEIDRKRLLGNLKNSASYSLELLENLLHWSRLEGGESNYHPEEVKLNTLISNCLSLYTENVKKKNISINKEIDGTIIALADKIMMETVYRNLISNAIKFSNPGGVISLGLEKVDGMIRFRITDQGIGMSEEQIKKVQENQGVSRRGTSNEKGAGMGLTLVREFTHLHQGKLVIISEPEMGSTFEVSIPA